MAVIATKIATQMLIVGAPLDRQFQRQGNLRLTSCVSTYRRPKVIKPFPKGIHTLRKSASPRKHSILGNKLLLSAGQFVCLALRSQASGLWLGRTSTAWHLAGECAFFGVAAHTTDHQRPAFVLIFMCGFSGESGFYSLSNNNSARYQSISRLCEISSAGIPSLFLLQSIHS